MASDDGVTCSPPDTVLQGKWIAGISAGQRVGEVAARVLDVRLRMLSECLRIATERPEEDTEHVHRLRIAARRSAEAVRMFSRFVDAAGMSNLPERLRDIRRAADAARNWDVLLSRFLQDSDAPSQGVVAQVTEKFQVRRREAQQAIVAAQRELQAAEFDQQCAELVANIQSQTGRKAQRAFGRTAGDYLRPAVKKFFQAAEADMSNEEALHALRIRAKRLRYTMEIVSVAFDAHFRKKLYPQISQLQDLMGTVNDHAMVRRLFRDWLQSEPASEEAAFYAGVLVAERRAHEDVRQAFLAVCTPQQIARLRRGFEAYV